MYEVQKQSQADRNRWHRIDTYDNEREACEVAKAQTRYTGHTHRVTRHVVVKTYTDTATR